MIFSGCINKAPQFVFVMVLFLSAGIATAKVSSDFNQGARLFKEKKYNAALEKFKKAEARGLKSSALYYNLASSYYKLTQYNKSKAYYNKVRQYKKLRYLAEYNLGLIALKQNRKKQAKKYFISVYKNSRDKKLKSLSGEKILQLRSAASKFRAYASLAFGNDDNINFAPSGISANRADTFIEFNGVVDYLFSGNRRNGWMAEASYYVFDYSTENQSDSDEIGLGIKKYYKINDLWQSELTVNYYKLSYGPDDYQTIVKLAGLARKKLSKSEQLYFRYGFEDISSDNVTYNYLAGTRQKARVEYRQYNKNNIQKIYYELEVNSRENLANSNYSPTRHTLRARYTHIFSPQWRATGDISYRASAYPAQGTQNRSDTRVKGSAYLDYYLNKRTKLRTKVAYTNNSSNTANYSYDRTVVSIGISSSF